MEWIKVSDRLPDTFSDDKFDRVLGLSNKVLLLEKGEMYFGEYNIIHNYWIVNGRLGNIQVTHWMPLPEPPTE